MGKTKRWAHGRWSWGNMLKYCDDSEYLRDRYEDLKSSLGNRNARQGAEADLFLLERKARRKELIAGKNRALEGM